MMNEIIPKNPNSKDAKSSIAGLALDHVKEGSVSRRVAMTEPAPCLSGFELLVKEAFQRHY